ncbi:MAG: hypothetical protein OEW11_08560 [Nitrospirota bacterium]|nr:hypothetical protein [Nitrospirota bacterium]
MRAARLTPLLLALVALVTVGVAGAGTIIGSRHDLSHFNQRGYGGSPTGPMQGFTFNDYREACIYCHTPHNGSPVAPLWNRNLSDTVGYSMYSSPNFNSGPVAAPDGISLACLSCHDGTVAVDDVRNKPQYHKWSDSQVHYKMDATDAARGSESCAKCHSRAEGGIGGVNAAHDASIRYLTQNLRDDHPISMVYPNRRVDPQFHQPPLDKGDGGRAFENGIQTYEGNKVQCATCHDIHNPDEDNSEGRDPFLRVSNQGSALCLTCHEK